MVDWIKLGDIGHGYEWDGFTVTRAEYSPASLQAKRWNQEARKIDLKGDDQLGKHALSMSELDRKHVARPFPGIDAPTAEDRNKEWRRFLASPLSEPYRVQRRH